ncbi:hypothetical protein K438DRAFT_1942575 [Mycena galopus ATCC 62051]|nr:hypothetical protein K438DRAFT_1942575 [Mycena galopus ATCC 62051]
MLRVPNFTHQTSAKMNLKRGEHNLFSRIQSPRVTIDVQFFPPASIGSRTRHALAISVLGDTSVQHRLMRAADSTYVWRQRYLRSASTAFDALMPRDDVRLNPCFRFFGAAAIENRVALEGSRPEKPAVEKQPVKTTGMTKETAKDGVRGAVDAERVRQGGIMTEGKRKAPPLEQMSNLKKKQKKPSLGGIRVDLTRGRTPDMESIYTPRPSRGIQSDVNDRDERDYTVEVNENAMFKVTSIGGVVETNAPGFVAPSPCRQGCNKIKKANIKLTDIPDEIRSQFRTQFTPLLLSWGVFKDGKVPVLQCPSNPQREREGQHQSTNTRSRKMSTEQLRNNIHGNVYTELKVNASKRVQWEIKGRKRQNRGLLGITGTLLSHEILSECEVRKERDVAVLNGGMEARAVAATWMVKAMKAWVAMGTGLDTVQIVADLRHSGKWAKWWREAKRKIGAEPRGQTSGEKFGRTACPDLMA